MSTTQPPKAPILYVCAESLAKQNGPALHVEAVVKRMAKLGHDVTLVQQGPYKIEGVDVIDIGEAPQGLFAGRKIRRRIDQAVRTVVQREKPRCIYARGSYPSLITLCRAHNIPMIIEYNGVLEREIKTAGVSSLKRFFLLRRERIVAKACDAAVAVDQTTHEGMVAIYPSLANKCHVIENGCDVERFGSVRSNDTRNPKRIAFVGSFNPWIKLDLLIEALALLPRDYSLDIVGDGERRNEFEQRTRDLKLGERVRFHGWKPHHEVPKLLGKSGIGFVVYHDAPGGLPLKLGEYLAAGCAPITNSYPGLEFIDQQGFGACLPQSPTPKDIADAVEKIVAKDSFTPKLIEARYRFTSERMSWQRTTQEILDLIVSF